MQWSIHQAWRVRAGSLRGCLGQSMSRPVSWCAAVVLLAAFAGGCGGGAQPVGYDPTMPPQSPPAMTLTSEGGTWEISLWSFPDPARKGLNDVVYRIADRSGIATDDLIVETQPWMPAHGHGTSTVPSVSPQGEGLYWAKPVNLYMSGRWELRTTIGGDNGDRVVFMVDVL